ncbi:FtsX-like permease family protein [Spirosoma sp. SC4-14]|uniref:ABC transporter permease n=1 Tax=Spirosoma sp. SC4-14 TaxID=3128900 RepID=UPI0030CC7098
MHLDINTDIAFTYLTARPKQTAVAAIGVMFGISMYIFMNSLITGTNDYFEKVTLSTTPHLRLYAENPMATTAMLDRFFGTKRINLLSNPQLVPGDNRIYNPDALIISLKHDKLVSAVSPQVNVNVVYSVGSFQENGNVAGVSILEQDRMFDITSTMLAGNVEELANNPNGIIIGAELAKTLSLRKGDNLLLSSSQGVARQLEVVGIFKTTIKTIDKAKTYVNVPVAQQLLRQNRSYITDIYINLHNYAQAEDVSQLFAQRTGYTVESWQAANEQSLAARMIRDVIANAVVITILIVAGFGIYNILTMSIYEKIKEIAILKATGFDGADVVGIFIRQAIIIGLLGGLLGATVGWGLSLLASRYYIGMGNITYLPMSFHLRHYVQGFLFGVVTSFFAGYIPARKAANVDPVSIIRG